MNDLGHFVVNLWTFLFLIEPNLIKKSKIYFALIFPQEKEMNIETTRNSSAAWGKLVSINPRLENVDLIKPAYKLGRLHSNEISIEDLRISGIHCTIQRDPSGQVTLIDNSSNGTYIGDTKIGKGISKPLVSGKTFYLLHKSKVPKPEDVLGYTFVLNDTEVNPLKRERLEGKKEEELMASLSKSVKPAAQPSSQAPDENIVCKLCRGCIYKCVTTVPCLHNFCSGCYSEWMERCVECPECQKEVEEIKVNAFVDNMCKNFLEKNPGHKRTLQQYKELDLKNKIHHNRLILKQKPEIEQQEEKRDLKSKWTKYFELYHRFTAE